jgi:hypothetical protein
VTAILAGCSSATSTINSIGAAISPASETEQTTTEDNTIPPEKPPVLEDEDCQFAYTFTADYQPEGDTTCEVIIASEVNDVSVSFEESRRK